MLIHVLPGDSLAEPFGRTGIEGEVVVCRECFVDGDAQAQVLAELWIKRSKFLSRNYGGSEEDYQKKTVDEFERLEQLAKGNEVVLWFEYELFCQVNLWFTVWFLKDSDSSLSVVYPPMDDEPELFKGFGYLNPEQLRSCFESRLTLSQEDVTLAVELWESFSARDFGNLSRLGKRETVAFPTLKVVVDAACNIDTRPRQILERIVLEGKNGFGEVFREFNERAPVFGFGDLQVERIFDEMSQDG